MYCCQRSSFTNEPSGTVLLFDEQNGVVRKKTKHAHAKTPAAGP